jgi:hypothetical protein
LTQLKQVVVFVALAYLTALLVDVAFYAYGLRREGLENALDIQFGILAAVWGFTRMWSVTMVVFLCLAIRRVNIKSWLAKVFNLSKRALLYYFASPLVVYVAFGVYVLIASLLGLFDFEAYVELIQEGLSKVLPAQGVDVEALARVLAYAQLALAYLSAITINAIFALGEEIGWRGYLFELLSGSASLKNTIIIGACWGFWHASAILLVGHNYIYNRVPGIFLFTLLTVTSTYPYLLVTKRSQSVLPASSLHGGVNALWGVTMFTSRLPLDQRELLLGLGVVGITSWAITSLLLKATCDRGLLIADRCRCKTQSPPSRVELLRARHQQALEASLRLGVERLQALL